MSKNESGSTIMASSRGCELGTADRGASLVFSIYSSRKNSTFLEYIKLDSRVKIGLTCVKAQAAQGGLAFVCREGATAILCADLLHYWLLLW